MTVDNAKAVLRCIKEDGPATVATIVQISESGRAPKNGPALFALALCASPKFASSFTRSLALASLPKVARTGTHLFEFCSAVQEFRGWGRGLREAVGNWYASKSPRDIAYQAVKYQQRNGWSHRDLLRLAHPKTDNETVNAIYKWIVDGVLPVELPPDFEDTSIVGYELAKRAEKESRVVQLIGKYRLTREMIPTEWLKSPAVWEALLAEMPMTAMIRNLATMTRVGLLAPMSNAVSTVVARLNSDAVRKAKVHPLQVLVALKTYESGESGFMQRADTRRHMGHHGDVEIRTWNPVSQIVDALDGAFYNAFGNVESTGKRYVLALDVSGSMEWSTIAGMPGITPRIGAAAMSMVTARSEPNYHIVAFCSDGGYMRRGVLPFDITPRERLDDIVIKTSHLPAGGTDCALPMLYALEKKIPVDVFAIYTDSETWAGNIHPMQALQQYRQKMGIPAKLITVGMVANEFSIADPADGGCMDVVGFDTATPNLIADFAR